MTIKNRRSTEIPRDPVANIMMPVHMQEYGGRKSDGDSEPQEGLRHRRGMGAANKPVRDKAYELLFELSYAAKTDAIRHKISCE